VKRVPRLPLEWNDTGSRAEHDGVTYALAVEYVRGEPAYWTVQVFEEPGQPETRRLHRADLTPVESFGCTKGQARATAERDAWIRVNGDPRGGDRPVIAIHNKRGTAYVAVEPGHGGMATVTTVAGSKYVVRADAIEYLDPAGGRE
jgi:hypothetical protein